MPGVEDQAGGPLGVGLTYFPSLGSFLRQRADLIDVVEVSPETLWLPDGRGGYVCGGDDLRLLAEFPAAKVLHGIGNPVGGSAPADPARLALLGDMAALLHTDLVSEHLSFARVPTSAGTSFTGFMLPPRQTAAGVEVAARSARAMADTLGTAFAIENGVSYLRPRRDEMADGDFIAAVAAEADVGILLDLHNAYANEHNGRDSMPAFVAALPLERVVEIHVAGGLPHGRYWLDAHSGAMPDAVFSFARELVASLPNLRVINFELMPMYLTRFGPDDVARQLDRCHELWAARSTWPDRQNHGPPPRPSVVLAAPGPAASQAPPSPPAWECQLASLGNEPDRGARPRGSRRRTGGRSRYRGAALPGNRVPGGPAGARAEASDAAAAALPRRGRRPRAP